MEIVVTNFEPKSWDVRREQFTGVCDIKVLRMTVREVLFSKNKENYYAVMPHRIRQDAQGVSYKKQIIWFELDEVTERDFIHSLKENAKTHIDKFIEENFMTFVQEPKRSVKKPESAAKLAGKL